MQFVDKVFARRLGSCEERLQVPAQITKHVTYHTFGHTFGTLLNANGENPKVVPSRQPEGDCGRLYAGSEPSEAGGPEQAGENDHEDRFSLTGPNWTMTKIGDTAELLYFVGVPDGI